ncbi:MAG: DUF3226 domain-containing protein [Cyanobacteria bacterium P01_D01_bin.156]
MLVEGKDTEAFITVLLSVSGLDDLQVLDFGNVENFRPFIKGLVNRLDFRQIDIQSIGVIRDAEQNSSAAFVSVCDALKAANLDSPDQVEKITTGEPRTGIYLLPGLNATSGMLEDLCLNMLDKDVAIKCVEQYFHCLTSQGVEQPKNSAKAKITAFLASRSELKQRVGYAMNQDYWNWEHPCLNPLKDFLKQL